MTEVQCSALPSRALPCHKSSGLPGHGAYARLFRANSKCVKPTLKFTLYYVRATDRPPCTLCSTSPSNTTQYTSISGGRVRLNNPASIYIYIYTQCWIHLPPPQCPPLLWHQPLELCYNRFSHCHHVWFTISTGYPPGSPPCFAPGLGCFLPVCSATAEEGLII